MHTVPAVFLVLNLLCIVSCFHNFRQQHQLHQPILVGGDTRLQCSTRTSEESALDQGWLEVRNTGFCRGQGLFTRVSLVCGTFIGIYSGEKLSHREYTARYPLGNSSYTFLVDPNAQRRHRVFIDAADPSKSNLMRYINHNRDANVDAVASQGNKKTIDGGGRRRIVSNEDDIDAVQIRVTACRDIAADEELFLDYGPLYTPALTWDTSP